jgi:hypothetical protein
LPERRVFPLIHEFSISLPDGSVCESD